MCEVSNVHAELYMNDIPLLESLLDYVKMNSIPGGTHRNWKSYGHKVGEVSDIVKHILADPQTSGGLLIAVAPDAAQQVEDLINKYSDLNRVQPIGRCVEQSEQSYRVSIR